MEGANVDIYTERGIEEHHGIDDKADAFEEHNQDITCSVLGSTGGRGLIQQSIELNIQVCIQNLDV